MGQQQFTDPLATGSRQAGRHLDRTARSTLLRRAIAVGAHLSLSLGLALGIGQPLGSAAFAQGTGDPMAPRVNPTPLDPDPTPLGSPADPLVDPAQVPITPRFVDSIDPLFQPEIPAILQSLPPNTQLRLPPTILISEPAAFDPSTLRVQILAARTPAIATINLMTCDQGLFPCLLGTIVVEARTSANGQRELARHRAAATPITLADGIQGYLLDGNLQRPPYAFSSVMWEQDNTLYTLSFPAFERQNLLFMALYMSRTAAIAPPTTTP
ncbi:hypothetical protein [Prochlorothrix hollandica]|uniref:Uncharacterized protein n=1 Tax=Prochlorothrix hollandica PCC 9006 = CALU 1027 TaxID=317619 RepID=A0A0M2Q1J7_PROHO|nr:hypothetical protein [Prochlorothrix hollandica]KKJ00814.1 hypothetical protein PROH_06115 [Prochlorothrix hollandica PCC 9006 = CALU 1027]